MLVDHLAPNGPILHPSPPRDRFASPLNRHASPGRVVYASVLPVKVREPSVDRDLPRLAHRMGARRLRRFKNNRFMDSVVEMEAPDEDDPDATSERPIFLRGASFPHWLAECGEATPPRRRPVAAPARAAERHVSEEMRKGAAMLLRLSKAERALLRTLLEPPETGGRESADAKRAGVALAERRAREFLRRHVRNERERWEEVEAVTPRSPARAVSITDDEWQLVERLEEKGDSSPRPRRASGGGRRRSHAPKRDRRRRRSDDDEPASTPLEEVCVLGVACGDQRRAALRSIARFYMLEPSCTPTCAIRAAAAAPLAPEDTQVCATLSGATPIEEARKAVDVSLLRVLAQLAEARAARLSRRRLEM